MTEEEKQAGQHTSWRAAAAITAWVAFAAIAIGFGIGAFAVGGHKGNSAVLLFSVSATCSTLLALIEAMRCARNGTKLFP